MNRVPTASFGVLLVMACLAAPEDNTAKSMQIAAERLGAKNAFEVARAVTEAKVWNGADGGTLPYRLHVPATLDRARRYPMVVHMHGAGSRGTNNLDQIRTGGADFISWATRRGEEYVFVAPQCPLNAKWVDSPWGARQSIMKESPTPHLKMAMELLDDIMKRYPVDRNRVYVMGISMGGYATWELLQRRPGMFAAALPCCGGGDEKLADRLADVAVWAFHGAKDGVVPVCRSRNMVEAMKSAGNRSVRYTEYASRAHKVWTPVFGDAAVFEWLFEQRKTGDR